jgi:hypothetical protein
VLMAKRRYCTECLSVHGKYYDLKTMSIREKGKFIPSGFYFCTNCRIVAIEDEMYKNQRYGYGKITIQKLSKVLEE